MAALAASLANVGPAKSGNPWPRFTAPYWLASRLISVNTEVPKLPTRGEAASRVGSGCPCAVLWRPKKSACWSGTGLRPGSPGVTSNSSLRLGPVLTKNGTQRVSNLAERCSGPQRLTHRRQKVSSGTGCRRHLGQGPLDGWPILSGLVGPYTPNLPAHCILVDDL